MNSVDEELLRTALNDAVPYQSNPQRIDQIKHRVRIARRRRVLITTATSAAALAIAAVITPALLNAHQDKPAASNTLSWNPASVITPDFMQQIADSQYQGWQELSGFPAKNGPKMVFLYRPDQPNQAAASGSASLSGANAAGSCSSDANSTTCTLAAQELDPGEALVLYGPLNTETTAEDIREIVPVDKWCSEIGGTQELRAATPEDNSVLHGGYACLDDPSPDVTDVAKQGLYVGYLPHSPYVFGSATESGS